jgi:hypothetical protein
MVYLLFLIEIESDLYINSTLWNLTKVPFIERLPFIYMYRLKLDALLINGKNETAIITNHCLQRAHQYNKSLSIKGTSI